MAEDLGSKVEWPAVILVDNSAAIRFQQSTNNSSKLKGMINLRDEHIKEMKKKKFIDTRKVNGLYNLADAKTKCLTANFKDRKKLDLVHADLYAKVIANSCNI